MLIGLGQRAANQNRTPLVTPRDLQVGNCRRTLTSIELSPASAVATRAPQCQKHPCENSAHSRVARLTFKAERTRPASEASGSEDPSQADCYAALSLSSFCRETKKVCHPLRRGTLRASPLLGAVGS